MTEKIGEQVFCYPVPFVESLLGKRGRKGLCLSEVWKWEEGEKKKLIVMSTSNETLLKEKGVGEEEINFSLSITNSHEDFATFFFYYLTAVKGERVSPSEVIFVEFYEDEEDDYYLVQFEVSKKGVFDDEIFVFSSPVWIPIPARGKTKEEVIKEVIKKAVAKELY